MKTETALALIDKARPTRENLKSLREKIEKHFGTLEEWPYLIDRAFEEFEVSVKICAGEQKAA